MASHRTGTSGASLKLTLTPPELIRCVSEQIMTPEQARGGVTRMTATTEIGRSDESSDTIIAKVTVRLAGRMKDAESDAFFAECTYRHRAVMDGEAPADDQIDQQLAEQIAKPLYYVALHQCQQLLWSMGYPGVRPALIDIQLARIDDTKPANKRRTRKKKAEGPA